MATIERTYNIPLRKEFLKVPKYRKAKKAVSAVKEFLVKHMKDERVKLGTHLNEYVWKDGMRNPPHHVKVNVRKDEDGVFAELVGFSMEKKEKKGAKKPASKGKKDEKKDAKAQKPAKEEKKE